MPSLIKPISLFVICFTFFFVKCSEDSSKSNPMGPGIKIADPDPDPDDDTTDSNPFEGEYSGVCSFEDGTKLKLEFSVDEDYSITGSEIWPSTTNLPDFGIEGEVSEDGDIWMYVEYEANGIEYTSEYEGTIRNTGKVSGEVIIEIAGVSFEGTWSASKGSGTSDDDENDVYVNNSLANTVWRGCANYEAFGKSYILDLGLCTNGSTANYGLVFYDSGKFKCTFRDAYSMTVNEVPINASKTITNEGTYSINGAQVEGRTTSGLLFRLTISGGSVLFSGNNQWISGYHTYTPSFDTEFNLLRVGKL
ncbi:MAG: hypothetical protein JW915_24695 [Chitinispirillaceae bacterium]|nr:hypothetical protein [Chitinispirillaceae bacterium]